MERQNLGRHEQSVRLVVGSLSPLLGIVLLVPGKASLAWGAIGTTLVIAGPYCSSPELLDTAQSTTAWDGLPGGPRQRKTGPQAMDGGDRSTMAVSRWAGSSGC